MQMTTPKPKRPTGRPTGRPPFAATDERRAQVQRLKLLGSTNELIAEILGTTTHTLRKHFAYELEHSTAELLGNVAASLYSQALAGNVQAGMFIMRTKGGWVERKELTGADGAPFIPASSPPLLLVDFSGLDDDEPAPECPADS